MRFIYIGFFWIGIFIFSSCTPGTYVGYTNAYKSYSKSIEKGFIEHPQKRGTYFCKFEVTNWEYNLFLEDIKTQAPALWEKCHPQEALWSQQKQLVPESLIKTYHSSTSFHDHPIVNIRHLGALEYCKWLTNYYNEQKFKKYKRVLFRLPQKEEYEFLYAQLGVPLIPEDTTNPNAYLYNLAYNGKHAVDGSPATNRVFEYIQTDNGYCSIIGNASEMTVSGERTGGSWNSNPAEVKLFSTIEGASPELGFRIVMEVLEN